MKIAILGWGSLIWDKRDLPIIGGWQTGGPVLPIEFSRISKDGRLTLVIDEQNGKDVTTRFALSELENLDDAIAILRSRESNPPKERIGFVDLLANAERQESRQCHPKACDQIKSWAQANGWQAVIWTALISNFNDKRGVQFSEAAAIAYLSGLTGETKMRAFEYIRRAPPEVDTPVRCAVAKFL